MAWLYVPGLEGSSSESSSRVHRFESSLMWRGTPMLPASWRREWRRGAWIQHLSGLTFEPSTVERGVESWISSLRASRASHSPSPVNSATKTMRGTSGRTSPVSSQSASQLSFSWRTSRYERLSSRGETFEDWASTCRVPSRVPPPSWVQDILGAASSYLPTTSTGHGNNQGGAAGRVGKKRESLDRLLATPNIKGEYNKKGLSERSGDRLRTQLLATPQARDWKDGFQPKRHGRHKDSLHVTVGGQVNPAWKEWFMGFPTGWTEIAPSATPSSPNKPPSPSRRS